MSTEVDETVIRALEIGPHLLDLPLMEVLVGGRDRIAQSGDHAAEDPEGWYFSDWNRCTCGHIYGAATLSLPRVIPDYDWAEEKERANVQEIMDYNQARDTLIRSPVVVDGIYEKALRFVADAVLAEYADADDHWTLSYQDDGYYDRPENVYRLVSDLTVELSHRKREELPDDDTLRGAAVHMLDVAIRRLEDQEREDMRRVEEQS